MTEHKQTSFVGIINATPDSFSDGDCFTTQKDILAHAKKLIKDGATILDIGAESTRPGALPIDHKTEWSRLEPALAELIKLCKKNKVELSLDTRHPETAAKGIKAGVNWINDVSGLSNHDMVEAVKASKVKVVLNHSLTIPPSPQVVMQGKTVVSEIILWGKEKINALQKAGIKKERIIFDPGIGFGKTAEQSLDIIRKIRKFNMLEVPVMVGHSRKSFLKYFGEAENIGERDAETALFSLNLALLGVDYLRVHNVGLHSRCFAIYDFLNEE